MAQPRKKSAKTPDFMLIDHGMYIATRGKLRVGLRQAWESEKRWDLIWMVFTSSDHEPYKFHSQWPTFKLARAQGMKLFK